MKKISFLMLLSLVFLLSCRTDQFPEKETYHNTSAFQLTNKRISLNDSKHKAKLLRELDNAEATFKTFSKVNAQGKVINYANGISIDTDEVLYIENGPNYHTYTFNLIRENALPTDPVENLVLTPLSDGTYKEFLVTYNLTVQEKESIRQGYYFYSGKSTTVTELAAGTYNVGGQLAKQVCGYESRTGWNKCSSGAHDGSNYLDCEFMFDFTDSAGNPGTPPTTYTYTVKVCEEQQETFIPSEGGGGGGNTTIGGSPEPELTPNECTVSATNPDEVGIIDANGCNTGFPTLPYTPTSFRFIVRTLPTEVKALLNTNTAFYDGLDAYYTANPTLQGENFVRWAAQFSWENQDVTWVQFQNWFIEEPILNNTLQNELFEDWADPNRVKPTTRFKNHAKINGIYNKIKTATNFNQILKNFTPEGSVAHLIFDIGITQKPESQAETSEPKNYWMTIKFNQNKDWANIPKVVIAQTFMHELIHAEILRQLLAVANSNGNINEATLLEYAKNHKHIELFNAYVKSKTNDADFQHQYMAQKYITTIVNFLKQVYGTQYTDIEYKTVAWMSSLKGTKAWNLLPQSERDLYTNTFNTNYWLWEL